MLPFSLVGAAMSIVVGQVISRTGSWRPVMWVAWAIMTLGYGLMITLDDTSNKSVTEQPWSTVLLTLLVPPARSESCTPSLPPSVWVACSRYVFSFGPHSNPRHSRPIDSPCRPSSGHAPEGHGNKYGCLCGDTVDWWYCRHFSRPGDHLQRKCAKLCPVGENDSDRRTGTAQTCSNYPER